MSPRIYGLPKIHKEGTPLRPVVSSVQSPTYNMSKFLANSISKILGKSEYHVRDSWEFIKFIKTIKQIPRSFKLISLDVVSLYTNVPVDLAIECIRERWCELEEHTALTLDEFIKGIQFCLNTTYFNFENQTFKQTFGTAMGSPISAVVANLVMEKLELEILKK